MSHIPSPSPAPTPPFPGDVHTVFVIGDLHGFLDDAERILTTRVGADSQWRLPDGVAVVQVGDLLHKGDDGPELLERVDAAMTLNGDRWVQLWGNHETAALQGAPPSQGVSHLKLKLIDHHRRRAHLSLPGGTLTSVDTGPHARVGVPGDPVLEVQVRSRCQVLQAA